MFPTFLEKTWDSTMPSQIAPEVVRLCHSGIETAQGGNTGAVTLQRLLESLEEPESDELGLLSPTQHSFRTAYRFLKNAENNQASRVPGSVATDSTGGIRVSWKSSSQEVRLIVPSVSEQFPYLYIQTGAAKGSISPNCTEDELVERLRSLDSKSSVFNAGEL